VAAAATTVEIGSGETEMKFEQIGAMFAGKVARSDRAGLATAGMTIRPD
jgi:hypothetical protein